MDPRTALTDDAVGRCRNCMLVRNVRPCQRYGGGNYRRGGRLYDSRICKGCAHELLKTATAGHRTVSRWSIGGLRRTWPEDT